MDYKVEYEKAFERAKNYHKGHTLDVNPKSAMEYVFPELKESEDERIRKSLIHYFSEQDGILTAINGSVSVRDILAWLEKQGEQKPTDKVEPKFKVGNKIKLVEEPKYPAREIIAIKNDAYCFDKLEQLPFINQDKWELVEQTPTDKIEQNPAWSEEDEERLSDVVFFVREYQIPTRDKRLLNTAKGAEKWLNSLKERYTWKPSDEQIEYLAAAVEESNENQVLESLYNDLKKLKEE